MFMPENTVIAVELTAERVALSVREVAQLLGVHRNTVYSQIQRGAIPVVYVGTKPLVPRRWIDEQFGGG
jgi:excisionase family DNA binding protein